MTKDNRLQILEKMILPQDEVIFETSTLRKIADEIKAKFGKVSFRPMTMEKLYLVQRKIRERSL